MLLLNEMLIFLEERVKYDIIFVLRKMVLIMEVIMRKGRMVKFVIRYMMNMKNVRNVFVGIKLWC